MTGIKLTTTSSLNLKLEGSVGRFRIAANQEDNTSTSLDVMYLETHVGFSPTNEALLRQLTPFRELFDHKQLDFEEMMQRDIDDARVSTELIPYLLDSAAKQSIKFFPPIVAVILPIADGDWRPTRLYPKVEHSTVSPLTEGDGVGGVRVQSGAIGSEAFKFEYPIIDDKPRQHDLARLYLNTNKVRLVIIDGQHRAMALLALHRNRKNDWNDAQRTAFKDYYAEWSAGVIAQYNLEAVQLPVVICAFPDLCEGYAGDVDVIRAARSTFLTLNKTARKVSQSRNILLDDRDLISHFLRKTLGRIKSRDSQSESAMRIWNVELDQYRDRVKLEAPVAITGVSHVYYAIEHLLFDEQDIRGIKPRSGKFHKRSNVAANLLRRLDGENVLGADAANLIGRHSYAVDSADLLATEFNRRYGDVMLKAFDAFEPYRAHNLAAFELYKTLSDNPQPQARSILYEGQNIGRSFDEYLAHMSEKSARAKEIGQLLPPEFQASLEHLKVTETQVILARTRLRKERAKKLLEHVSDSSKLRLSSGEFSPILFESIDDLFDNVFTTVAFQAALICGFFDIIESAGPRASEADRKLDADELFDEYIKCQNEFFAPATAASVKNLVRVFFHDLPDGPASDWKRIPSEQTFRGVVAPNEMKPDEWPKYRYLTLELWKSTDPSVEQARMEAVAVCRKQTFQSLYRRQVARFCEREQRNESDLLADDRKRLLERTLEVFNGFLKSLGSRNKAERVSEDEATAWATLGNEDEDAES